MDADDPESLDEADEHMERFLAKLEGLRADDHIECLLAKLEGLRADPTDPEAPTETGPAPVVQRLGRAARPGVIIRDTWELLAPLGKGGFGQVFEARHGGLDRIDAIKILHAHLADDDDLRRRFHDEARIMARLRGEHLVVVHDYGEHDGRPFFAMECLRGVSLHTLIEQEAPLAVEVFFPIAEGILQGLVEIHEHGIIHRDIKPANLFIERRTRGVKMLDFGLAKSSLHLTSHNLQIGTPVYMAPELLTGVDTAASVATDVYAVGVVLYQLLTGRLPFVPPHGGDVIAFLQKVLTTTPELSVLEGSEAQRGVGELVLGALHRNPWRRPRSARDFLEGLREAKHPVTGEPKKQRWAAPRVLSSGPPIPHLDSIPCDVLISFSPQDEATALRLAYAIERTGISLKLGGHPRRMDRAREGANDEAIEGALAVIIVASPDSKHASGVLDDLDKALLHGKPVIPVWVRGGHWGECIDPRLGELPCVDARDGDQGRLQAELTGALTRVVARTFPSWFSVGPSQNLPWENEVLRPIPPGIVLVEDPDAFGSGLGHCFRLDAYRTIREILDAVYLCTIHDRFPPFTYGKQWVLVESRPDDFYLIAPRVAVPWWWPGRRMHGSKKVDRWAMNAGPNEVGMDGLPRHACWKVVGVTEENFATTVAAKHPDFFFSVAHQKVRHGLFRGERPQAKLQPWSALDETDYREMRTYAFPRGWPSCNDGDCVVVQAHESPPNDDPRSSGWEPSLEQLRDWFLPDDR